MRVSKGSPAMLLRWIGSLLTSGAVLVAMRWLFHAGKPRDDLHAIERVAERAAQQLRETWATIMRRYGPITDDIRSKWELLRESYMGGDFGVEGT